MNLLEFNDALLHSKKKRVKVPEFTSEDVTLFNELINVSNTIKSMYDYTDDANSFFTMFPDIKKILGAAKCVEIFYAHKLGYHYAGIPCKLVYIVSRMMKNNDNIHINRIINGTLRLLKPYANNEYECNGEIYTVKDVIDNIAGRAVPLITEAQLKVHAKDCYEVFIKDTEEVALIPNNIADLLSYSDCEKLEYDSKVGIVLGDIPIRTLCGNIGITRSDYDLRECF